MLEIKSLLANYFFLPSKYFRFFIFLFLLASGWEFVVAQGNGDIPVSRLSRIDNGDLLEEIINSRKGRVSPSSVRREAIRMLAYTLDERKFLFLNQIQVKRKLQHDLILLDIDRQESHHYRFNNPILYSQKKRKLMSEDDWIISTLDVVAVETEMVRHPRLIADLLFIKKNERSRNVGFFPSLQIGLDNGQERYLLGKIYHTRIQIDPIKVERMYLSHNSRFLLFILSHNYRKDNDIHQKMEVVGFDLYKVVNDPLHKVTADQEFALSPQQKSLSFQKNFYYNERDELLYTETLYHSGLREVEGAYELY